MTTMLPPGMPGTVNVVRTVTIRIATRCSGAMLTLKSRAANSTATVCPTAEPTRNIEAASGTTNAVTRSATPSLLAASIIAGSEAIVDRRRYRHGLRRRARSNETSQGHAAGEDCCRIHEHGEHDKREDRGEQDIGQKRTGRAEAHAGRERRGERKHADGRERDHPSHKHHHGVSQPGEEPDDRHPTLCCQPS